VVSEAVANNVAYLGLGDAPVSVEIGPSGAAAMGRYAAASSQQTDALSSIVAKA